MTLPVRARLALFSGGLVALLLVGMGAFLYTRLEADLLESVDDALSSRAAAIAERPEPDALPPGGGDEQFAQLLSPDGDVLASSGDVSSPLVTARTVTGLVESRFLNTQVENAEGEHLPVRVLVTRTSAGRAVVVGASLDDQREALASLLALLAIGGPVAVALASGIGWLIARAALRPVERMRVEAEAVSASEPGRRLPVAATRDELGRLGESLNGMLARLEEAAERERRFVDDAAHELRTPLANLKAELELALRRDRTPEALASALRSAEEEAERLVRLAEDLLVLSRADRGRLPLRREDSDVARVVEESAAAFRARASERGISVEVSAPEAVRARLDGTRFRQMIGNLLENSLRHTPAGGRVALRVARRHGGYSVEIADTGTGFPSTFLARAFEPFGRSDDARSRDDGGTGLGLTIVRAVAEAHGGRVEARNRPEGGAVVTLTFPGEDLISGSRPSHGRGAMLRSQEGEEET